MPRMALLLSFLTLGCFKQKAVTLDFGHGTITLHKAFRFEPREIEREPDSARFAFTRVNDTHINGTTSYAEKIVVSHLAPDLDQQSFRKLLSAGHYDALALSIKQVFSVENEANLEFQFCSTQYERHPVSEKAIAIRLIDLPNRRVLTWYGYAKRYTLAEAKTYLKQILATVTIDPELDSRFPDYKKWEGNNWMEAYFDNRDRFAEALDILGLTTPFQQYIGDVSNWESKDNWHVAIDGDRPSLIHLVQTNTQQPCSSINDISPILRSSFQDLLTKQKRTNCFKVHHFNLWQKLPEAGNPIADWVQSIR